VRELAMTWGERARNDRGRRTMARKGAMTPLFVIARREAMCH